MRLSDRLRKLHDRIGTIYHDVENEMCRNTDNGLCIIRDEIYSVCDEMEGIIYDLKGISEKL